MLNTQAQPGDSITRDRGIILLAAFVAVLPLIVHGASCGQDLDFHMTNWMETAAQWQHGILWPRWAFTPAWGAGEPRFLFYPPLSWLLGGALTLLMPVRMVPAAFTFITLTACGLTMRRLAAEWTSSCCALLAAVFYMTNPYMLFCAYERSAYGELLAAAWMPLLLLAVLRLHISVRSIAVPVALLWLTNAPSAVMSCYLFALIALLRLALLCRHSFTQRRMQTMLPFALRSLGGVALGMGLAAFYIVPAAWERRWIQVEMVIQPPMDIASNTLFRHTFDADHDAVLHTASCLALLLIAVAAVLLLAAWRQHGRSPLRAQSPLLMLIAAAVFSIAFALTPLSLFAWLHLPELRFLQFPWRLLALGGVLCGLLLALAARGRRFALQNRFLLAAAILLPMLLVPLAYRQFSQICYDEDVPSTQVAAFRAGDGIDPTDEYTPRTADNDALNDNTCNSWITMDPQRTVQNPGTIKNGIEFSLTRNFRVPPANAASPQHYFVIRLRNYPAWQVRVNGNDAQSIPRPDGLIAIALPQAEAAEISIRYRTLPDEGIGVLISLVSLIIFLLGHRRARHRGMHALYMPIKPSSPFMAAALPT
ncbi:MAG TPA: hypothetical protein VNU94_07820 [Acidobacteriaceae bacterium]|nr:hypothetical protein [Acidobacteriaceae bacterium]